MPKVCIVLPIYNSERFLTESLQSLCSQTYRDFEVLAVDDCSTDSSSRIVESFQGLLVLRSIRTIRNLGVAGALNVGIQECRSPYMARMDADDVAMQDRLEKQVLFLDNNPDVGVLGTAFLMVNENLSIIRKVKVPLTDEAIFKTLGTKCCIGHPTVMARIEVMNFFRYNDTENCKGVEDYDLWLRARGKVKMANLPDFLLKYRIHQHQVSRSAEQSSNLKNLKIKYGLSRSKTPA